MSKNTHETERRSFFWFVRRGLFDFGLAVASLALIAILFAISIATHTTETVSQWLLPFCWTVFIAFVIVKTLKRERKNPVLWFTVVLLILLQLIALQPIVKRFPNMHSATYMLLAFAAAPVWFIVVRAAIGLSVRGKRRGNVRESS
ncbi:MAG: hypothetical protein ACM3JB_02985 [Acidobacteriaceae bacterium]